MWDDVIIGKGERGSSARTIHRVQGGQSISENQYAFWITDCICGLGITILKTTLEGENLKELIDSCTSDDKISNWIDNTILRRIDPEKLRIKILESNNAAFNKGLNTKAAEMRKVLDIK